METHVEPPLDAPVGLTVTCAHCGQVHSAYTTIVKCFHTRHTTEQVMYCSRGCLEDDHINRLRRFGL